MFVVWGTRINKQPVGYVADFCPLCRKIEAQRLFTVSKASHLYYISLGKGRLLGHLAECQRCRLQLQKNGATFRGTARTWKAGDDLDALIVETLPNARQMYSRRLELEEVISKKPETLDAPTRLAATKDMFQLLAPVLDQRLQKTQVGLATFMAFIVGLAVVIGAGIVMSDLHVSDTVFNWTLFALSVAGVIAICYLGIQGRRRFWRTKVYPLLAYGLQPLRLSQSEVETALAELRRLGFGIAKKAKAAELIAAMQVEFESPPRVS